MIKKELSKIELNRLVEMIQSANLSFLLWAWASCPFLEPLWDIEEKLTGETDRTTRLQIYRDFFLKVIRPNYLFLFEDSALDKDKKEKLLQTQENYKSFFETLSNIILRRKSSILCKQINVDRKSVV